ncbi:hypothetical protein GOBAR_AA08074 [Gossypium barbadense]|uniref:Uncharacterized protein n=1 Tax=Gossypium barbadense TaxID=3634 RepID=A0A2P5YAE0_GOSBA|nr:hypothetical protein GOBAR_AA08074 [Gossypium barbadense]
MSLILKRHPSEYGTNHTFVASHRVRVSGRVLCQLSLAAGKVLNMGNLDALTILNLVPLDPSMVTPLGMAILANHNTYSTTELGRSQS